MSDSRRERVPAARLVRTSVALAALLVMGSGCATTAGLSAAGETLRGAGYEVHDLPMEKGGSDYADPERPDGATDGEHFETAGAINRDHLEEEARPAEIRLRGPEETDEIATHSATELQEIHRADDRA